MGYLCADGTVLLKAQWYDAQPFSEGLAAVRNQDVLLDTLNEGYKDETLHKVTPPLFGQTTPVVDGQALVWGRTSPFLITFHT